MKELHWIGSSKDDLCDFPNEVKQEAGYALHLAQSGGKALNAVPMVGFGGAKVLEVVINDDGETYRAVYTVKFQRAVYVLHAFQKKSKRGTETPKPDMDLIRLRLRTAQRHYEENYDTTKEERKMTREHDDHTRVVSSVGNVFADLGLPAQEKDMLKVQIAMAISAAIEKRGLTQVEAAKIVNSDQAKISGLLRGRLDGFSVERLIQYLVLLGKDIDIRISGNHKSRGRIRVKNAA